MRINGLYSKRRSWRSRFGLQLVQEITLPCLFKHRGRFSLHVYTIQPTDLRMVENGVHIPERVETCPEFQGPRGRERFRYRLKQGIYNWFPIEMQFKLLSLAVNQGSNKRILSSNSEDIQS